MQSTSLEGRVILWIEDDATLRDFVANRIVQEGCIMLHAGNGPEGLKCALAQNPDLIILDIQLPVMNGFEVLSRIKSDAQTKDIPVAMLSNLDDEASIKKALSTGAFIFLVKSEETPASIADKIRGVFTKGNVSSNISVPVLLGV